MRTTDDHDRELCPECDKEYIAEIAQTTTNQIDNAIQPAVRKAVDSLYELSMLLLNIYKANPHDKRAMALIHEFGMTVNECVTKIEMQEESLICVDDKLTEAFIEDIESRDDVYLCRSCYEQSCDHHEEY
jgi:hypothetical protein